MSSSLTLAEVAKHNTKKDCWVIIHGKAYDLTNFLAEHPGGSRIIMKFAGKVADSGFDMVHSTDIIDQWEPSPKCVGHVEGLDQVEEVKEVFKPLVPLGQVLTTFDFEYLASKMMTPEGWDYYSSGADDEVTMRENHSVFSRIWLRPRVLVDVSSLDPSHTMMGTAVTLPMYITATALARLAHPEGEVAITKAAGKEGIIYMQPTLASATLDDMLAAKSPGQDTWYQCYVNQDRKRTLDLILKAQKGGATCLALTVDAPQLGRREKDMRHKFVDVEPDVQSDTGVTRSEGTARAISAFIDPSLNWSDVKWFKEKTSMKIILKGIQTWEDAVIAHQHGVDAIVLSNHGGRQLDYAPSSVEILPEVMDALNKMGSTMEVYVDGGIRRGTDIFKALALGATGVGVGRPIIYSLASHGQAGVERCIQLLRDEFICCMRLMGVTSVDQICRNHVNTRSLLDHSDMSYSDLSKSTYIPMTVNPKVPSKL